MRLILTLFAALVLSACEVTDSPQPEAPAEPYDGPVDVSGEPVRPGAIVAVGEACGGMMGLRCQGADSGSTFCNYEPADLCGAADAMGRCTIAPVACPRHYRPVCGCDGETYANACLARAARTGVADYGPCEGDEDRGGQIGQVPPTWPPGEG